MTNEATEQELALFPLNDAQLRLTGMSDKEIAELRKKQWGTADDEGKTTKRASAASS